LKKLILLAVIVYGFWNYDAKNSGNISVSQASVQDSESISSFSNQTNYQCDGREHCSQMSSYEEAKFFIENCPNTKMDGDHDGIPCERQFGR